MARLPQREIVLYGELPAPCYVLRLAAGVQWRTHMLAAQRLVKRLTDTPRNREAPYWNVTGDAPPWETTKQPRYAYDPASKEFLKIDAETPSL